MKNGIVYRRLALMTVGLLLMHCAVSLAEEAPKETPEQDLNAEATSNNAIDINFNNVDITAFIKYISEKTGKNFIIDDRVKGKVTIISPGKISPDEAYRVFESVLEVHGYSAVPAGEIIKIVSAPEARTKSVATLLDASADQGEDKMVTQLIPLKYADPNEIKRLFAPLISKSSVILAYPATNMLIITDMHSNILRLQKIIKAIDITGTGQQISILSLEYADAGKMVKILETVFEAQKRAVKVKRQPESNIKFVSDERTNTIILRASEVDTERIKQLIELMDKDVPQGKEKVHVYYLENAIAEELAKVLNDLPKKQVEKGQGKKSNPIISKDIRIMADKATNSLIIMAEKEEFKILVEVIKQLDIPRAMVYIECLIMEVNIDKNFNVGTEWRVGRDAQVDGYDAAYGLGFGGGSDVGYSMAGNLGRTGAMPPGFSVGAFSEGISIGDVLFPNLAAIVQAYKKDKDVHILSTPQILTTDHEEASISVGKNVPYLTKIGTTSSSETYSNYEYKDVGITLKITPHITKDRFVRLNISQIITKMDQLSTIGLDRPTTLKRTVDTTVIVHDNNTIVIGGLIDDSFTNTAYRVPCFGYIPVVEWLFKAVGNTREQSNLFFFLTPKVIKNPGEAAQVYSDKNTYIRQLEDKVKASEKEGVKLYPGEESSPQKKVP